MSRFKFRHTWDSLRVSFWFAPAVMSVGAILLVWAINWVDERIPNAMLRNNRLVLSIGVDQVRGALVSMATTILATAGVVFTLLTLPDGHLILDSDKGETKMPAQLESWNDGAAKTAIIDFVRRVTDAGSADFVPPSERIATFDNDGTLWCEKPLPIQFDFILRRWVAMAQEDPALRERQPWKSAVEKDYAWLGGVITKHYAGDDSDLPTLMNGLLTTFAGVTTEDYAKRAEDFLRTQSHPSLKRLYRACGYSPMIDLLHYLEANGFANYIVSGGGRDFMRPITPQLYGIPPERVVGSSVDLDFRENGDGGDVLTKSHLNVLDDGPAKPAAIWSRIGKRPILAAGNSNGDIPMLQFANKPPRRALRLLVLHDDARREFDYTAGAEKSLELAKQYGWTIVSMKNDWKEVFG
jgi:hypothetical protein